MLDVAIGTLALFIGQPGLGFAAKRAAPKISLGVLIAAASFLEPRWLVSLSPGSERVRMVPGRIAFTPVAFDLYPISHGVLATVGWPVLGGRANRQSGATVATPGW
ncbi:MAG: hypothetical protein HYY24_19525 [Verrucomicrobia bacterium]|nr:hypothetical protein [Verrucomicrobiota bacterium]